MTVSKVVSENLSDSETKPNKAPNQSQSSKRSVSSNDPVGKQLAKASSSVKMEQEQRTETSSAKEVNGALLRKPAAKIRVFVIYSWSRRGYPTSSFTG